MLIARTDKTAKTLLEQPESVHNECPQKISAVGYYGKHPLRNYPNVAGPRPRSGVKGGEERRVRYDHPQDTTRCYQRRVLHCHERCAQGLFYLGSTAP